MSENQNWRRTTYQWLKKRTQEGAHLRIDSRDVNAGDVFVALRGAKVDALKFLPVAKAKGARAVLMEKRAPDVLPCELEYLEVDHLREHLGAIASDFYDNPSNNLFGVAITGTNGKTSISHWCATLLTHLKMPCAAIGTIGTFFRGVPIKAPALTTPDAVSMQGLFYDLNKAQAKAFAIEASSIGLDQGRLDETAIKVAVFTNLTRDHLDYHKTEKAYAQAKAKLFTFDTLQSAVINLDDMFGRELAQRTVKRGLRTIGYRVKGISEEGNIAGVTFLVAQNVHSESDGMVFEVLWENKVYTLHAKVLGLSNVYNLLAVAGIALSAGLAPEVVFAQLTQLTPPAGRLQLYTRPNMPMAVVDYCHTPDAIEKALCALRPTAKKRGGKLWILFGAGGDRDHGKRPQMAAVAEKFADCVVVTSDNPRSESPESIAKDIAAGFKNAQPSYILNRREAIVESFCKANAKDVILIAGKGHEDYQEIQGIKHHFSDVETVREAANERFVRERKK